MSAAAPVSDSEAAAMCVHQILQDPQGASTKCVKWFMEWNQCQWDQEKLRRGYTYIEPLQAKKHRPFYTTPSYRYS